jgi:hypothetical protein
LPLLHHLLEHHPSELEYLLWEPMPSLFYFSALSFCNLFSCHFGKPIEHIGFISVLDNSKSFSILGTLTIFCLDVAPSIGDFPTSLLSIAGFFSNVIGFLIVKLRSELFSFGHHTSRGKPSLLLSSLVELQTDFDQNNPYKMMIFLNV